MATQNLGNVTVARVLRPHGRKGEVACEILTDFPERLTRLAEAELWDERPSHPRSGLKGDRASAPVEARRVAIRSCWLSHRGGGQAVFHFEGSSSISDAEKLVGLHVQIPYSQRVVLPAGSYYISDLIGCEVYGAREERLGVVREVQTTGENVPGAPLLLLSATGGELIIPLAEEICVRVDTAARRIDAVLPEGLRELNEKG